MSIETKENGIATFEDFRQAAEARAMEEFEEPQRVVLPGSGMAVILRRPRPAYFSIMGFPLPASMAMRMQRANGDSAETVKPTTEELNEITNRLVTVFSAAFVKPRLALNPGPDEISPNWLLKEDAAFLYKFCVGEILAGGADVAASFRGEAGRDAGSGADGGALGGEAKPTAVRVDGGVPD